MQRFPVLDEIYASFISAIRAGDISAYDAALEKWERRLVELNLWLTLEKARELCLRGLFRRVYVPPLFFLSQCSPCYHPFRWVAAQKSTRIPIPMFHCALRISGSDVPQEEAECLVANMIYKGFMRGYISHGQQMVVLASTNAFPKLADRVNPFMTL
jgi:hypothetical protein